MHDAHNTGETLERGGDPSKGLAPHHALTVGARAKATVSCTLGSTARQRAFLLPSNVQ